MKMNYKLIIEAGVIMALINIAVGIFLYAMGVDFITNMWVLLCLFLMIIILPVFFGLNYRKKTGGYLSFKNAFAALFIMVLIRAVISNGFDTVLYRVVDPEFAQKVQEASIQKFMTWMGAPQDKIDEAMDEAAKRKNESTGVKGFILSAAWGIVMASILCAIIGACIKKDPPFFDDHTLDQNPA